MTPFNLTNHSTRENIYIYDFKGKWKIIKFKPDELCSDLEKAQKIAPKLILMADNENKNNTIFAFLSELVLRGWFSEIEMLFGPVGHTHNGNDAVHHVHNNIAGNLTSVVPAILFHNYKYAWKEEARPQPIIMECQYAWGERYKAHKANRVVGFTSRGIKNPDYIRAFRFTKNGSSHLCEMHVKGSPSNVGWHGVDSVLDSWLRHFAGVTKWLPSGKEANWISNPTRVLK